MFARRSDASCRLGWGRARIVARRPAGPWRAALCALLVCLAWQQVPRDDILAPPDLPRPDASGLPVLDVMPRARIDLTRAVFLRDGRPSDAARIEAPDDEGARLVRLPVDGEGVRWSTIFETEASGTSRLRLDFSPGPQGMLFEVVLDGERLPPPRDGWRPTRRRVVCDLGPRWLGRGTHLLEFVAREQVAEGAFSLHGLLFTPPE